MMTSDIRNAAILILLPAIFAIGASPARAQSFTRTFELKGLEDGERLATAMLAATLEQ